MIRGLEQEIVGGHPKEVTKEMADLQAENTKEEIEHLTGNINRETALEITRIMQDTEKMETDQEAPQERNIEERALDPWKEKEKEEMTKNSREEKEAKVMIMIEGTKEAIQKTTGEIMVEEETTEVETGLIKGPRGQCLCHGDDSC